MNNPITSNEIKTMIKNLPKEQKPRTKWLQRWILSTFREELTYSSHILPKNAEEENFQTHALYEAAISLIQNSQTRQFTKKITGQYHWWRLWHLTPVLLPGKSNRQRSLVGCSPWGCEESDTTEQLQFHALEKQMATHSSVLAWRIPEMGEPGGLLSMSHTGLDTTEAT